MGLLRKSDGSPSDLLEKWYPNGYKSEWQATPVGMTAEVIDAMTGGIDLDPGFAALQARVAVLEQKLAALETEFGLHDNNGKHWTGQEIDTRAETVADTKVTAHTDAYTHTPV